MVEVECHSALQGPGLVHGHHNGPERLGRCARGLVIRALLLEGEFHLLDVLFFLNDGRALLTPNDIEKRWLP